LPYSIGVEAELEFICVISVKEKYFPQRRRGSEENEIGSIIVNASIKVHRELGPGLIE